MGFFSGISKAISTIASPLSGLSGLTTASGDGPAVDTPGVEVANYAGSPLSALASAGVSLANSYVQDYFNRKAASRQNDYTWSLLNYQNDWNLAQWNRENEYNSPKNIMARYQEAGLNPNLIYGNSYASPSHLESAGGNAPQVKPAAVDLLAAYNLELQNYLLQKQIDLTDWNAQRSMNESLLAGRRASMAFYDEEYAKREYEIFKKSGIIPERYSKANWDNMLVNTFKSMFFNN